MELHDGVRSPSGPFNHGLDLAEAPFTAIMGSDDELEPGAVDSWLRMQRDHRADFVISRLRFASGKAVASPPTRPLRTRALDGIRDRLAYRSAPLGLLARERFGRLRLEPGMQNGGDNVFVSQLWFAGATVSFDRRGPAYLIHDDASDRVTFTVKPVVDELAWVGRLVIEPRVSELPLSQRQAIARKVVRVHVFGALFNRRDQRDWYRLERSDVVAVLDELESFGPGYTAGLSRTDHRLLALLHDDEAGEQQAVDLATARRRPDHWERVITPGLRSNFLADAPLRMAVASRLAPLGSQPHRKGSR